MTIMCKEKLMRYKILVDDIENNKPQFDEIHANPDLYGGSSVANVCGVGYLTPLDMWLRRTGRKGQDPVNAQMRLGNFLEPFVAELFSEAIEQIITPVNQVWQRTSDDWMIASPDAFVGDDKDQIAEFKTGRSFAGTFWKDGQVSDSALVQVQWYLAVSGLASGWCVGMFGGDATDLRHEQFMSDPGIQDQLYEQVEKFRKLVKEDTPPAATEKDGALVRDYLAAKYDKEKEIDLSDTQGALLAEFVDLSQELEKVKPAYSKLEKRLKALKNQLVAVADGAAYVHINSDKFFINRIEKKPYMANPKPYYTVKLAKRKEG